MTTLNLSIELTEAQSLGVAQARTAYNATLSENATPLTDTEYLEYVLNGAATSYAAQYSGSEPVPPSPVEPVADWKALRDRALSPFFPNTLTPNPETLYPIFDRVRDASFASSFTSEELKRASDTSTALGFITDAILTVKDEGALYKGLLDLKEKAFYTFTVDEKALWQAAIDELNFTPLVYLP
jgi:hypothetical protein